MYLKEDIAHWGAHEVPSAWLPNYLGFFRPSAKDSGSHKTTASEAQV